MGGENLYFTIRSIFAEDNYNHANQPDLQVPGMYNTNAEISKLYVIFLDYSKLF
jgi:hypothetical protein